jgi:hypothetical protein
MFKKLLAILQAQWLAELSPKVSMIGDGQTINDDITIYRRYIFTSNRCAHYTDFLTMLSVADVSFRVIPILPRSLLAVEVEITEQFPDSLELPPEWSPQNING